MAPAVLVQNPTIAPVTDTIKDKLNLKSYPADLQAALDDAKAQFTKRNPNSLRLHEEAVNNLPGGNTRTLLYTTPFPLSMKSGKGHQVTDEDDHTYTDFVGELTAGLYGHSNPNILSSLTNTISTIGLNLGATTAAESRFASLMRSRFNLGRVRFCNSGTEANLHALAGARKYTGKRKVVVFSGGYHGAVLSFGSGQPAENNVDLDDWVLGRYNDVAGAKELIEGLEGQLAAVLVEGMQGAGGCIIGTKEFLAQCQESAHKIGALFMLDEVMTSRLAPGGLQSLLSLTPDLTTFGKYLGGGLAFGAFGGSTEVMSVYDPRQPGSLAHSGTFNNNTLAMHAGYAGLHDVYKPEVCEEFSKNGDAFREKLNKACEGTNCCFSGKGTIMAVHFSADGEMKESDVTCVEVIKEDWELKDLFWLEMMEEGYWISRRGTIAMILGTPQEELDRFVAAVESFLERHRNLVRS
ncbi:glutamate-1-semialdehyde aminotransferase [Rhizodiscina lignyota]|uniref:Glutamate-1-semialdehyde aminotransferase n=1 Tax=Rhizodiscina lignyota TaxID=1504668 RepID=A0A9P4I4J0_9PEZI|nr:glutamate-1-semialdehyde aminotransferase [Rhizodiscina lignyota]